MKRFYLGALCAIAALTSCETMHDAAVSTFRVVDAPHAYIRRQLGMDENGATTTTTTTTETTYATNEPGAPGPQPYNGQPGSSQANLPPPPPPTQTSRQVTAQQKEPEPPAENSTPSPKNVAQKQRTSTATETGPKSSAASHVASSEKTTGDIPYAKPVPGKPGYVFSPYDKNGGYVDVTGYSPGQKVKDPYSGKIFLVP